MRYNGLEVLGRHLLKAQKHFDFFVENLYFPAKPIRNEDLPGFCLQIIAGQVLSDGLRPLFEFGANQLDLSHIRGNLRGLSVGQKSQRRVCFGAELC